ncbi:MAG: hypothetical protein WA130_08400 [Candidatus Methanoperedens sp.]
MVNIASLQELSGNYSTIAAILLASGSAFIFIIKIVTEKAISSQFDKHDKEMGLRLERRSRFEEAILLYRYRLICKTEVFEELAASRYLLTGKFHRILHDQSHILIRVANEQDAEALENLENKYLRIFDEFHQAMNDVFGIDRITWDRLQP